MLTAGDIATLTIEKPAAGGRMIARSNGQIVLVHGAIPGERVRARIDRVSKGVAFADAIAIEHPSPDRRAEASDLLCGGALLGHIAYRRQLDLKSAIIADALSRIGRIVLPSPVAVAASPEAGYRMRARLHVRGARIGFFREGTHDLCDPRSTGQLLAATCDSIERLAAAIRSGGIDVFREIEVTENLDGSERAIALDAAGPVDRTVAERLAATEGVTGLCVAGIEVGRPRVTDHLAVGGSRVSLTRHVLSFFQGNRYLLQDFVNHVVAQVPDGAGMLDLYAGVGLFAVSAAAARRARVTAVEGERIAARDLAANAARASQINAVHDAVESYLERRPHDVSTIVVDPPRTGMSREALDGALRLAPQRLIYVSCDVATLARDARRILDRGFTIGRADAFDLFPNTPHVETVVVFDRP